MMLRRQGLWAATVVAWLSLALAPVLAEDDLRARTRDGREVLLKEDGTWEFAPSKSETGDSTEIAATVTKPEKSVLTHKGKVGTMSLWLVPGKWKKLAKPTNPVAEVQYQFIGQDISAVVIHEDLDIGLEELTDIAVGNLDGGISDAEVIMRERRKVNGQEMIALRAVGKIGKAELIVCAHYASGEFGSIQAFVLVPRKRFEKYETDIEAFLAGVVVHETTNEPGKEGADAKPGEGSDAPSKEQE
jgi:hypothetical protein